MHWVGVAVQFGQVPQMDKWMGQVPQLDKGRLSHREADTGFVSVTHSWKRWGWAAADHLLSRLHGRK